MAHLKAPAVWYSMIIGTLSSHADVSLCHTDMSTATATPANESHSNPKTALQNPSPASQPFLMKVSKPLGAMAFARVKLDSDIKQVHHLHCGSSRNDAVHITKQKEATSGLCAGSTATDCQCTIGYKMHVFSIP